MVSPVKTVIWFSCYENRNNVYFSYDARELQKEGKHENKRFMIKFCVIFGVLFHVDCIKSVIRIKKLIDVKDLEI